MTEKITFTHPLLVSFGGAEATLVAHLTPVPEATLVAHLLLVLRVSVSLLSGRH